ncbi:DMT family transporter [Shimazuella kribbensis]|uniref:DMT family transporter n=1 Tax=Shimazuella kribbensis TaxID=139808 RepID=UPI0003F899F5|nr:EamA family transporter [Shimazuella kribbensis]
MIFLMYGLMCFIFSTTFLVIKLGIEAGLSPIYSAGLRFTLAGILVCLFFAIKKASFPRSLQTYIQLCLIGLSLTGMTFATLYWAEQYISSGLAALLSSTGPIIISFFSAILYKQKSTPLQVMGLIISFLGVSVITLPSILGTIDTKWLVGAIAVIIGEVFYSLGTVKLKSISSSNYSPFLLNGIQMFFGGIGLLIFSVLTESKSITLAMNMQGMLSILYLTIIGSIVGHGIYAWLIKKTNPLFPSTWLYISPVVALILGSVLLKEELSFYIFIGGFMILLGLFFVNVRALQQLFLKRRLVETSDTSSKIS